MAQSRNLTYLDSPFKQGIGKATVVNTGDVATAFNEGMKNVRKVREDENTAIKTEKAEQKKTVEDYKVDYFIGHQAYFQNQIDDVRKEGVNLMMKNYNLKDMTNPEVAAYQKRKIELDSKAKLSKDVGTYMDKVLNMTPADKAKIKTDTYNEAVKFLDLPYEEQVKKFQDGTMSRLEMLTPVPQAEIRQALKNISDGLPKLYEAPQANLDVIHKEAVAKAKEVVYSLIDPSMINSTDPAVIKEQIDEYAQAYANTIGRPLEDLKSQRDRAQKEADRQTKKSIAAANNAAKASAGGKDDPYRVEAAFNQYIEDLYTKDNDGDLQLLTELIERTEPSLNAGGKDRVVRDEFYREILSADVVGKITSGKRGKILKGTKVIVRESGGVKSYYPIQDPSGNRLNGLERLKGEIVLKYNEAAQKGAPTGDNTGIKPGALAQKPQGGGQVQGGSTTQAKSGASIAKNDFYNLPVADRSKYKPDGKGGFTLK